MPTESLRVCLGSLLVFGDWNFLRRCKSRKPRSVMRGRLSGVATFELLVLAGSHGATQVTWQGTRQIYNENLLSRLGSLGRFIESQMFSRNVLLLTNRHFLMEKNFLSENFLWAQLAGAAAKRSQQLCTQARQCLGQRPSASELLILLPHTRGAHHGWCFRLDPACSSSAVCQVAGAGLRTTMPSALLPPALVFKLKDWLHTKRSRSKHYSIFRVSQQLSLLKITVPSLDHQQAGNSLGLGVPKVSVLHSPSSPPVEQFKGDGHTSLPGSWWWGVPGCLSQALHHAPSLSSKPTAAGSNAPGIEHAWTSRSSCHLLLSDAGCQYRQQKAGNAWQLNTAQIDNGLCLTKPFLIKRNRHKSREKDCAARRA